ncbi:MAG: hypothetical protein BGO10_02170 [Chlamydia sp. 32-24]|nr:MAG: hypothetical protein BGO10_02170 [Chlamydia sp. 32-24]
MDRKELWEDIKDILNKPRIWIRRSIRRIKRFIAWFPIIWKDEDWDSAYLFEIMRFKISRIRQEIEHNKRHIGYEKHVQQMHVTEELLKRISFSDFYFDHSQELRNEEKAGKCQCPKETHKIEPCSYDAKTGKPNLYEWIDVSCDYCKKASSRWRKRDDIKTKEDFDYLLWHLKKHVRKWWD